VHALVIRPLHNHICKLFQEIHHSDIEIGLKNLISFVFVGGGKLCMNLFLKVICFDDVFLVSQIKTFKFLKLIVGKCPYSKVFK